MDQRVRSDEQGRIATAPSFLGASGLAGGERLDFVVETMREMSRHCDPQAMVRAYNARMQQLLPTDRMLSLSRRGLVTPEFRITRYSGWPGEVNPWQERERLPLLRDGLLAELIYADQPRIIDNLRLERNDPAFPYLNEQRSLMAIPNYDNGAAMNMVVMTRRDPAGFDREQFPQWVWLSNLFGQAAHNLVRSQALERAYDEADRELNAVAHIQRSLLPGRVPRVPTLDLAIHYQTSRRAGGDYYDFFPLPEGRLGIFIGDVSGHGTPAAVLMAVTHSLAHTHPGPATPPGEVLARMNRELAERYTAEAGTFVTAFYGVYDPAARTITYASAGHNPPRAKRCPDGSRWSLDGVRSLPLGVSADEVFPEQVQQLRPGDQVVYYTDGVTEAEDPAGRAFGLAGLDRVMAGCADTAPELLRDVLAALESFTAGRPAADDRTLVVAKIS